MSTPHDDQPTTEPPMTASQVAWAKAAEDDRARAAAVDAARSAGGRPDWLRVAAAVLVAIASVTVWFVMAPQEPYEAMRSSIASNDDAADAGVDGAHQPSDDGRTTDAYLHLLSVQQEEADDRRDALLLTGLLSGALALATSRRPARR